MTNTIWSFYNPSTGLFDGTSFAGDEDGMLGQLAHKPEGSLAFAGKVNHTCQMIDATSKLLVDFIPAAPANDDMSTWEWDSGRRSWMPVPTLLAVKALKWTAMKAERDAREAGTFTALGWVFQINQVKIVMAALDANAAKQGGDTTWSESWLLTDNTAQTLSADQMIGVARAMKSCIGAIHATSQQLRAEIDAATSIDQVNAIAWPA